MVRDYACLIVETRNKMELIILRAGHHITTQLWPLAMLLLPPYMWGPPQPMMPPYGAPYATIYPHGGVYVHPAVPLAAYAVSGHSFNAAAIGHVILKMKPPLHRPQIVCNLYGFMVSYFLLI
ncbi:hypothetical protein V6N12_023356 [Hibiscus sabdariffa]|uniref:G-box binding protein multifunctional mosaic region domain-containing protein n=1 Tax=Hibiscus sabdariffa TaxID=183260 RepID=A0ABR2FYD2_9ROSI